MRHIFKTGANGGGTIQSSPGSAGCVWSSENEEKLVDDILSKPISKEENEMSNPQVAKTEKSPLSEPTLDNKNKSDKGTKSEKPSVREEIKAIREEQKKDKDLDKDELKKEKSEKNKTTKHKQPKSKKKKSKERG